MVDSLTLYPLGVGDFGATSLFHTSFLLRIDGHSVVIDCPRRFAEMLRFNAQHGECTVTVEDYQEIILTHLHIDHAGGIVEMIDAGTIQEGKPITLYAPASTLEYLWSISANAVWYRQHRSKGEAPRLIDFSAHVL
jgi:ribonuclease BN (tRNA processing enzyme)